MANDSEWITQMVVLEDQRDPNAEYEHDYSYVVEYTPDGDRRTRKLNKGEVEEVRVQNGFPAEEVRNENEDSE